MEHSTIFYIVKRYYDDGTYTKDDVKKFVVKGKLSPDEYKEITGEKYKGGK